MTSLNEMLRERGSRYGDFGTQANISQAVKSIVLNPGSDMSAPQMEAMEMIIHKISRIVNGDPNYADSWRDIAGYATLVADYLEANEHEVVG